MAQPEKAYRKCTRCNVNLPLTTFKQKRCGNYKKRCEVCCKKSREYVRNKNRCEHGREKSKCKDCGGVSVCCHGRIKSQCKDCGGGSICSHNRQKSRCKDCGGSQICPHNRDKSKCKDCGGSQICPHNRQKSICKECDFQGYLGSIVRNRTIQALKSKKSKKTLEYLGCNISTFKQHIQKQFKPGMTWDNYGSEWHIDHVIPLKYNKPTLEQTIERLHYKNTQPLWAAENIAKGNRYIG